MNTNEQTTQKIERFLGKIIQKFPEDAESGVMTDLHIKVVQDSGELLAFDDDEQEITRCVVDQWIDNKDDDFYPQVAHLLREAIVSMKDKMENLGIMKPYSFVLRIRFVKNPAIISFFYLTIANIVLSLHLQTQDSKIGSNYEQQNKAQRSSGLDRGRLREGTHRAVVCMLFLPRCPSLQCC